MAIDVGAPRAATQRVRAGFRALDQRELHELLVPHAGLRFAAARRARRQHADGARLLAISRSTAAVERVCTAMPALRQRC